MKRLVWMCLLVVGCRESGTITIRPDESMQACSIATQIRATFEREGSCEGCTCDACELCNEADAGCIHVREGGSELLPIDRVEDGLVFEPPEAGSYSAIFQYITAGEVTAVVCVVVTVEADGTSSETKTPEKECCTP